MVDFHTAGVVWTLLSYPLLAWILYGTARSMDETRRTSFGCAVLGAALGSWFGPVVSHVSLGQINLLLMALVTADVLARHPRWPRGALIGLAAAVKLTPAAFVLIFLLRRDWRAVIVSAVSALAWTIVGAVVTWSDSVKYWSSILHISGQVQVLPARNYSLHGLFDKLPLGMAALPVTVLAALVVILVGSYAISQQLAQGALAAALMANAIVATLISPVSWQHHWVWAVPTALVLLLQFLHRSPIAGAALLLTTGVFLVGVSGQYAERLVWSGTLLWAVSILLVLCLPPSRELPAQRDHEAWTTPTSVT
jgi:alpha-1,2-mannosyltransferase